MRYNPVNIGGPIVVAVLGAILAFAVGDNKVGPMDMDVLGYILIAGAVIWLVLGMVLNRPKAVSTVERTTASADGSTVQRDVTTDGL